MSKEVNVNIKVDSKDAVKDVDKLNNKINQAKESTKQLGEGSKDTGEKAGKAANKASSQVTLLGGAAKKATKGFGLLRKGIIAVGTALKAAGIGLVVSAIAAVSNALSSSQPVLDGFNTAMETITGVVIQFVNGFVEGAKSMGGSLLVLSGIVKVFASSFKISFTAILGILKTAELGWYSFAAASAKALGNEGMFIAYSLQVTRVKGEIDDLAKETAIGVGTLVGGYQDIFKSFPALFEGIAKGFKNIDFKKATSQAAEIVKLRKLAQLAELKDQELQLKSRKLSEDDRQIRDDVSKTVEERIKANDRLGEQLNKENEDRLKNAKNILASAQAEFNRDSTNLDNQLKLQEAKIKLLSIEEEINGQQSEQIVNTQSLIKEQQELAQSKIEGERRVTNMKAQFDVEQALNTFDRIDGQQKMQDDAYAKDIANLEQQQSLHKVGSQARQDIDNQIAEVKEQKRQDDLRNERALEQAKIGVAKMGFQAIADIAEEGSAIGKAASIAAAVMSTYEAATAALGAKPYGPWNIAQAAIVTASGLMNVKKIMDTKIPGGDKASTANVSAAAPQFNIVGGTQTSQLAGVINQQTDDLNNRPIRTYVVASDVSTNQALDRQIEDEASLGD